MCKMAHLLSLLTFQWYPCSYLYTSARLWGCLYKQHGQIANKKKYVIFSTTDKYLVLLENIRKSEGKQQFYWIFNLFYMSVIFFFCK